jgi:hypothetical protein
VLIAGCQTTEPVQQPTYTFPSLDAFEPPRVPVDLIDEPQTDVDLLHNSIQYEFLLYDWQDYADSLKDYIGEIRDVLGEK